MQSQNIQTFKQFQSKCFPISQSLADITTKYFLPSSQQSLKIALLRQFITTVTDIYDKFLQSYDKLCIVFFDCIKDQFKQGAIQILSQPKFSQLLYEYDSFFYGNTKQLRVYKKNYDIQLYLSKYKLDKNYGTVKPEIDDIVRSLLRNKREMNVKFSLDENYKDVEKEYQSDLKKFQKIKKKFLKLLDTLLEHFKEQEGRYKFQIKEISVLYKDQVQRKVEEKNLLCFDIEGPKYEYQLDITKPGKYLERQGEKREERVQRENTEKFEVVQKKKEEWGEQKNETQKVAEKSKQQNIQEKILSNKPTEEFKTVTHSEQKDQNNKTKTVSPAKIIGLQPSKISSFKLLSSQPKQVKLSFESPPDNGCPITHYNIYTLNPNNPQKVLSIPHILTQTNYEFTLSGSGYTQFTIKAQNQAGESLRFQPFQIIIPSSPNSELFMRGQNLNGMIPNVEEQEVLDPIDIKMGCFQVEVSSCVMVCDSRGNIATWGNVYSDQTKQEVVLDTFPPFKFETKFVNKISCSEEFYLCSDILGNAYGFGKNMNSELGIPKIKGKDTIDPVIIPYFKNKEIFVTDIACKGQHSIALDSKGNVYCWGANQVGVLGYPICDAFGDVKNFTNVTNKSLVQTLPRLIQRTAFGNRGAIKIAIGEEFCCVINEDNELYSWGSNHLGQLGVGKIVINHNEYSNILCPATVSTFNKNLQIVDLSVGSTHCLAICKDTKTQQTYVYSWGSSENGECGHEEYGEYYQPRRIQFFKGHKVEFVRACKDISFVKTDQGFYEFGMEQKNFRNRFEKINYEWAGDVVDVSSNGRVDAFLVNVGKSKKV